MLLGGSASCSGELGSLRDDGGHAQGAANEAGSQRAGHGQRRRGRSRTRRAAGRARGSAVGGGLGWAGDLQVAAGTQSNCNCQQGRAAPRRTTLATASARPAQATSAPSATRVRTRASVISVLYCEYFLMPLFGGAAADAPTGKHYSNPAMAVPFEAFIPYGIMLVVSAPRRPRPRDPLPAADCC